MAAGGPETVQIELLFWSQNLPSECTRFSSKIVDYRAGVILFDLIVSCIVVLLFNNLFSAVLIIVFASRRAASVHPLAGTMWL